MTTSKPSFRDQPVPATPGTISNGLTRQENGQLSNGSGTSALGEITPAPTVETPAITWQGTRHLSGPQKQVGTLSSQLLKTALRTVLAPLVVIGLVGAGIYGQDAAQRLDQRLRGVVSVWRDSAHQSVEGFSDIVQDIALNPWVITATKTAAEYAEADGLAQQVSNQKDIKALEDEFEGTHRFDFDPTLSQDLQTYVQALGATHGDNQLAKFFIAERHGLTIASSIRTGDFVQSDETWWQNVRKTNVWLHDPARDPSTRELSVDFSHSIIDPETGEFSGAVQGVLSVRSDEFSVLEAVLTNFDIEGTEEIQLLDVSAAVDGDPETTAVLVGINATDFKMMVDSLGETIELKGGDVVSQVAQALVALSPTRSKPGPTPGLASWVAEVVATLGENPNASLKADQALFPVQNLNLDSPEGKPPTATFSHAGYRYVLTPVPETDWVVSASISEGQAFRTVWGLPLIAITTVLYAAGLIILIIRYQTRKLTQPLASLSQAASQVAAGDLEVKAQLEGTQEVLTLGQSFNNLVRQVRGLLQQGEADKRHTIQLANLSRCREDNELESNLNPLLISARADLEADRVVVYRFYPNYSGGYIAGEAVLPNWPSALGTGFDDPCISDALIEAYKQGRVVPTRNVHDTGWHPDHMQLMERLQIKANLVVPILQGENLFGLLIAHHCQDYHDWQESEIDDLTQLAQEIGPSLASLGLLEQQRLEAERERRQKENLQRDLINLLSDVEGAAQGDLRVRAELSSGEIGTVADFFNVIIESLRGLVVQVKQAANQMNDSVAANKGEMQELAVAALDQAAEITNTLNSLENMTQSIQDVAASAQQAAKVAQAAAATAETSGTAMNETVESILGLRGTVAETAKKVKRLGESSQQISTVVSLINQIALKTNILALNARIEAARAGEEGEGFVVVAEEVGALADQSARATQEIEQVVATIQKETSEVVMAMETGTSQVVKGTHLVQDAKESLGQILTVAQEINNLLQSISQATVSQSTTSQAVTALMQTVTQTSRQTAASSQEVADSLEGAAELAQELEAAVGQFKVEATA